ncbi:hypothetical protein JK628_06815 [Shewanella sp. KX20019]|uniref:hypothetical protein n=1 Tax=Shewanella sp. KX20019 TaxID=2803864 RepID=UPI001927F66C|nr:hypothetical protein [Shewanella sp. KX20019]QQX81568.1 hypothetical protein JK628_06815 [Shewanella sp. KX20019]
MHKQSNLKPFSYTSALVMAGGLIALLINSPAANAAQCQSLDSSHLSARYAVSNDHGVTKEITLLRNHQQVIYQHNPQTFELWNTRGEYVRYFPSERRSVSYRKGDLLSLNMHFDFNQLNHLISPATIADMQQLPSSSSEVAETGTDLCMAEQLYQGTQKNHQLTISWLNQLQLPKSFKLTNNSGSIQYELVEVKPLTENVFNGMTAGYQDIDFADVGDNESDPFIAKMIHQGFIPIQLEDARFRGVVPVQF